MGIGMLREGIRMPQLRIHAEKLVLSPGRIRDGGGVLRMIVIDPMQPLL